MPLRQVDSPARTSRENLPNSGSYTCAADVLGGIKILPQVILADSQGCAKTIGTQEALADGLVDKSLADYKSFGYILNRQHLGTPLGQN